jgi:hypothetical protein
MQVFFFTEKYIAMVITASIAITPNTMATFLSRVLAAIVV